jgi:DNA polymerase-4
MRPFLDLAGTQKLHRASPAEALHRLQQEIKRDIGISVSVGLKRYQIACQNGI